MKISTNQTLPCPHEASRRLQETDIDSIITEMSIKYQLWKVVKAEMHGAPRVWWWELALSRRLVFLKERMTELSCDEWGWEEVWPEQSREKGEWPQGGWRSRQRSGRAEPWRCFSLYLKDPGKPWMYFNEAGGGKQMISSEIIFILLL